MVENHRSLDQLDEWQLSPEPILQIGAQSAPEEYQLHWVNGATRLDDGGIAVTNAGSKQIRFFDAAGKHLRSIGGEGEGPGEFRFPVGLWRTAGDSLAVWDETAHRMTLIDADGDFGRTATANPSALRLFALGVRRDGAWLLLSMEFVPGANDFRVNYGTLMTYRSTGELSDTVAVVPWWELKAMNPFSAGRVFGWQASAAPVPDGVWYGDSKHYEVRLIGDNGQIRQVARWQGPDRAILARHVDAYWARLLESASAGGDEAVSRLLVLREKQPVADQFPAYSSLLSDRSGCLWVRDAERPGGTSLQLWTVLSAEGELLATVRLPAEARMLEIGDDYVIVVTTDHLDIQYVQMYSLTRS